MNELTNADLNHTVRHLPADVRKLVQKYEGELFVSGGYLRSKIAKEEVQDVDLFGTSKGFLRQVANELQQTRGGDKECRLHITDNAITVLSTGRMTVQFITRWTFNKPEDLLASFDFTICQSLIFVDPVSHRWTSRIGSSFYQDLAAKRLIYTHPIRDEEVGGSLLRVLKFTKRGYNAPHDTLGGVIARMMSKFDARKMPLDDEEGVAFVLRGLLQEVDPLTAIDGLEVTDDPTKEDEEYQLG